MLRIAINATPLLSPIAGIGRYVRELSSQIAGHGTCELHYFAGLHWSNSLPQKPIRGVETWKALVKKTIPTPYEAKWFLQGIAFSRGTKRIFPQLYHEMAFLALPFTGPTVITVHDLAWVLHPEVHPRSRVEMLRRRFPHSLARATHVITDSESVRQELLQHFDVAPSRVTSIPLGPSEIMCPRTESDCAPTLAQLGLHYRRFILCVGTIEPRKNLEASAYSHKSLPTNTRSNWPIVIVGATGWQSSPSHSALKSSLKEGSALLLDHVSDSILAVLYSSARMLLYPSIYEGFGLPLIEAMASGTPVITSQAASLLEVANGNALVVDPRQPYELRDAILRLIEDDAEWNRLRDLGLLRAKDFSWDKCGKMTVAVYRSVLEAPMQ